MDAILLRKAQKGDDEAYAALFTTYEADLYCLYIHNVATLKIRLMYYRKLLIGLLSIYIPKSIWNHNQRMLRLV